MNKYILSDFDGTLLFMDQEIFVKQYYKELYKKFIKLGYDGQKCIEGIMSAVMYILTNEDNITNEIKFWKVFENKTNLSKKELTVMLEDFYNNEFCLLKQYTSINPYAKKFIETVKNNGYKIILATNPVFPKVATDERIKWAGLNPEDFEYITTYENSCFCKPNLKYYQEIIEKFNLDVNDLWMIGNDMNEDGVSKELGLKVLLTTDNLINKHQQYDVDKMISWSELINKI